MSSQLDINTERGAIAAYDQTVAAAIAFKPPLQFFQFPNDGPAKADGFFGEAGFVKGICEIKSRDCSLAGFRSAFNNEWLLTYQKLLDLSDLSTMLNVPGWGVLYLNRDNLVLTAKLTGETGRICCHFRTEQTETKATCNGGKAVRVNAYIDMRNAYVLKGKI